MKNHFKDFEGEFLNVSEDNFSVLLRKTDYLHERIIQQVEENVPRIPLPERFYYSDVQHDVPQQGKSSDEVMQHLATAFQGSIRWNQPESLVNIIPNPLLDSVAAANIATLYNTNSFWDYVGGNVTKFEKDVVAFLSHLANWDSALSEGLSTSGGKATLMYAIRCGLNVCDRQSVADGLQGEYVVITGKSAHYSVEDNCNYLGIGRRNVLRVDVDETGAMLPEAFEETMRQALQKGKKIAAVIALGGDTLEHAVDPIRQIYKIRGSVAQEYNLDYVPFLHLDSVNAWISMAFREYDFSANPMGIDPRPLEKIKSLSTKMSEVVWADSFSADFHKTGLAPYISSFFVVKDGTHLHSINKIERLEEKPSYQYGEMHTHHISFENSRSSSGILSAWTSMQRLGVNGYRQYWAQLMTVGAYIRGAIERDFGDDIKVLNTTALGHPNVIQINPTGFTASYDQLLTDIESLKVYSTYCFELYEFMAYHLMKSHEPYPLLGFVPSYKYEITGIKRPAFLIYLNQPHITEEGCDKLLRSIISLKQDFEIYRKSHSTRVSADQLSRLPK